VLLAKVEVALAAIDTVSTKARGGGGGGRNCGLKVAAGAAAILVEVVISDVTGAGRARTRMRERERRTCFSRQFRSKVFLAIVLLLLSRCEGVRVCAREGVNN
jgi:hypothetical protein